MGPGTAAAFAMAGGGPPPRLYSAPRKRGSARVGGGPKSYVLAFISNQHVGPDMEIELFVLGSSMAAHDIAAR